MFKIAAIWCNPTGVYNGNPNIYRVYKNPNARDLFMKAQTAATVEERRDLFEQMGEYELVDETPKLTIKQKLKNIFRRVKK